MTCVYHLTSTLPARALVRTPLKGLYPTSPDTLSWSTRKPEYVWFAILNATPNAGSGVARDVLESARPETPTGWDLRHKRPREAWAALVLHQTREGPLEHLRVRVELGGSSADVAVPFLAGGSPVASRRCADPRRCGAQEDRDHDIVEARHAAREGEGESAAGVVYRHPSLEEEGELGGRRRLVLKQLELAVWRDEAQYLIAFPARVSGVNRALPREPLSIVPSDGMLRAGAPSSSAQDSADLNTDTQTHRIQGWNEHSAIALVLLMLSKRSGFPDRRELHPMRPHTCAERTWPLRSTTASSVSSTSKKISFCACRTPRRRHGIGAVKGAEGVWAWRLV